MPSNQIIDFFARVRLGFFLPLVPERDCYVRKQRSEGPLVADCPGFCCGLTQVLCLVLISQRVSCSCPVGALRSQLTFLSCSVAFSTHLFVLSCCVLNSPFCPVLLRSQLTFLSCSVAYLVHLLVLFSCASFFFCFLVQFSCALSSACPVNLVLLSCADNLSFLSRALSKLAHLLVLFSLEISSSSCPVLFRTHFILLFCSLADLVHLFVCSHYHHHHHHYYLSLKR